MLDENSHFRNFNSLIQIMNSLGLYLFGHLIQCSHQLNQRTNHLTSRTPEVQVTVTHLTASTNKKNVQGTVTYLIWLGVISAVELHLNVPPCFLFPVRLTFIETS